MKSYIFEFTDPSASLETVGGKGFSLVRMSQAGFPVPPGFILTTEAYRSFVSSNGLQSRILKAVDKTDPTDTAGLDSASQTIAAMFTQGSIPPEVAAEIGKTYQAFQDRPVAVRSSATAEDLPDASFAGQQETYLNIRGFNALLEAVKKCWASLWTARAISYRVTNQIDPASVALAVVVQEMVFADAAGVMFTANPVNGRRNEVLINAAWGLGEAVVSGAVTPDTLTVEKTTGKILERLTAEKEVMTVRTADGTEERPTPAELRHKAVLTNRQAAELSVLGTRIEEFYNMPMDIEWALAGGKFAIVQARPITALPPDWTISEPNTSFLRGSLAEHLPSPVSPLFETLGLRIANEESYRMAKNIIGKNYRATMSSKGAYITIHGYVYGGIKTNFFSVWLQAKAAVNQFRRIFRGSVARWNAARNEFLKVINSWEMNDLSRKTAAEIFDAVKTIFQASCQYFTVLQTCLPAASASEMLFTRYYTRLIKRAGDPEACVFLFGSETQALRAEKSLFDLAMWLKQTDPLVADYIQHTSADEIVDDFTNERPADMADHESWKEFQYRIQIHLEEFGRTAYEFDFKNPTPIENPGLLLEAVKAFLNGKPANPYERQENSMKVRVEATNRILKRLNQPKKSWFEGLLRWAQETGPMREDGIADMGLGHPLIRRFLGELGRRFVCKGALAASEDVYWITEGELESLVKSHDIKQPLMNLTALIRMRKAEWKAKTKINPPVALPEKGGYSKVMAGKDVKIRDGKTFLTGVGTSGGSVTAPACVLQGPEDFNRMREGDILVAVTTTPAWTPLFTLASAVVTDIGGPLSHSSIVAREFGIPAVMAARSATRLIKNGQMVTVDGDQGTVTLSELNRD